MLTYLRENTGNWIIKIFLGIIVIVFVFLGVGSFRANRNNSVASINDEPISVKEYQQAYKTTVEQYRARFGNRLNEDLLNALNVKQQALEQLIDQKIILSEADKLGITVSARELRDNLLEIKAFQENGIFNMDRYKMVLSRNAMNPEIFEALQQEAIRQKKLTDVVLSAVNVTDLEARNWYLYQNEQCSLDYVQFNPASYTDIQPADEDVQKYYETNKENYKSSPMREAEYIQFSASDYKDDISISEQQVKAYYEQNIEQYKTAEQVEARHILFKVAEDASEKEADEALAKANAVYEKAKSGEDFETLAKEYSEGPSKNSGGYLGKFEKGRMVKPFGDKAFSMKAGEISEPVRTIFGWHIIQVINRFDAATQSIESVQDTIKKQLESLALKNIAYDKAGEAFDAVIDGDDFKQVALIADKKIIRTPAFDITGKGLKVRDKQGFAQAAFELSTKVISDVKQFGDDYFLIQVTKMIEPEIQPFDVAREKVKKDLQAELQKQAARKDAEAVLKAASDSGDLLSAAKTLDAQVQTTPMFSRTGNIEGIQATAEYIEAAFSLKEEKQVYADVVELSDGFHVLSLKEKAQPGEKEISDNLEKVKQEILSRKRMQSMQAWMDEVKKHYTIKYDPKMFN